MKKAFNGLGLPQVVRSEQDSNQIREQRMMAQQAQQLAPQLEGIVNE